VRVQIFILSFDQQRGTEGFDGHDLRLSTLAEQTAGDKRLIAACPVSTQHDTRARWADLLFLLVGQTHSQKGTTQT